MTPSDQLSVFFTSGEFGHVAGLKARAAILALSRAHSGKTWRGHTLSVIAQRGRGGASGLSYLVRIDSLPLELRIRAEAMFGTATDEGGSAPLALPAPATGTALAVQNHPPISLPAISASTAAATREWEWKREIIHPAMILPKGSAERADMIRRLAQTSFLILGGGHRTFSETTLRGWLNGYEAKGIAGLCRKGRTDRGRKRVLVSRDWDCAVASLPDEAKADITAQLRRYVRSLWAEGVAGWRNCARLATAKLVAFTRAAGLDLPNANLLTLCEVPRKFVEAERAYSIIAMKDKDAKAFFDKMLPRVRRSREGMAPMALVVADVHHTDILYQRADGSLCTPKAITWCDLATNRLFMTIMFLAPGEGVRQEHVIASFIDMTQHPEWGMPQALYLDNGGEFSKLGFVDDAMKLTALAQGQGIRIGILTDDPEVSDLANRARSARRRMVIHAQPYNAPAKPIEGLFGVLEGGAFAMLPGWIGGNRMKAKTQNIGRAPIPFPGTEDQFRTTIVTALDFYHTNPQSGSLKGKSPREAFAAAVTGGWKRIDVDRLALQSVFAKEIWRTVTQGEFTLDGTLYRADRLLTMEPGSKVCVRAPLVGDKARLAVLDEAGNFLCIVEPSPSHGFLGSAGAKDKRRRASTQTKAITIMRHDTDAVELVAEMREAAALAPLAPTPESGGTIRLSDDMEAIAQATKQLPALRAEERDTQYRERLARRETLEKLAAAG